MASRKLRSRDYVRFKGETHQLLDHKWRITAVWDTNCEGMRANLEREIPQDRGKPQTDHCSAQCSDLVLVR